MAQDRKREVRAVRHVQTRLDALKAKYGTFHRVARVLGVNSGLISRVMNKDEWIPAVNRAVFYHDWGPAIEFLRKRERGDA